MGHKARKLARWQAVNIASNGEGNRAGRLEEIAPSFDVPAAAWLDRGQAASMGRRRPCVGDDIIAVSAYLGSLPPQQGSRRRRGIKRTVTVFPVRN